jgi:dTDP-4-amino-4,6-dideoxygalactose transaminase
MSESPTLTVPIARTALLEEEIRSVLEPLRSGWLVQGPKVREFERKWCDFTGARHSVAVSSCTAGLELALAALDLHPGDEVIVPAFTWVATANVVEHLGAKIVFCDIDARTFNLDVTDAESRVTPRTRAIVPVHLFGLAADMVRVRSLADRHGLSIVEDAACGFGTRIDGRHVGRLGSAGCFSFHPRKAITTGEGGMITTDSDEMAARLRRMRDHGADMSDLERHSGPRPYRLADHPEAGYNFRMTDIQGALGSAQMERAEAILAERSRLAAVYDAAFKGLGWLRKPSHAPGFDHAYQSYPCMFEPEPITVASVARIGEQRNAFMDRLQKSGVSTRPATHAVHMLSFYRTKYRLAAEDLPKAWAANDCSLSLPLFNGMTEAEQAHVIEQVTRLGP